MTSRRTTLLALAGPLLPSLLLSGCALSPLADPLRVELAGVDALPGEGLELRFMVRLRVQNPNRGEFSYEGVALELDLRGQRFASGVAPLAGAVPGFGEAVLAVPVTASGLSIARQLLGLVRDGERGRIGKVPYAMRGKLGGVALGAARFESRGEIDLDLR